MPTKINIPGLGMVNFPDSMTPDEINVEAEKLYNQSQRGTEIATDVRQAISPEGDLGKRLGSRFFQPLFGFAEGPEDPELRESGVKGAIPTTLGLIGAVGGSRFGHGGRLAGESIGGGIGEYINQKLGITEESPEQVGLAVAAPGLARGIGAGTMKSARWLAPRLPGAGSALRSLAREEALAIPATLRPDTPSTKLFAELEQVNPQIPLGPIRNAARGVGQSKSLLAAESTEGVTHTTKSMLNSELAQAEKQAAARLKTYGSEDPAYKNLASKIDEMKTQIGYAPKAGGAVSEGASGDALATVRGLAKRIENTVSKVQGADTIDFQTVHATMKDLNAMIGAAKANRGAEFGALMQLKRGFWEALENAANSGSGAAYTKLKQANRTMRQEIAHDALDDIVFKNFDQFLEGTADLNSTAARAMNQLNKALRDDEFLRDSFPPGSVDKIIATFDKIRQLPVRGAPPGADAGSKRIWQQGGIGGGLGSAAGAAIGGPVGGIIGGGVGTATAIGGSALISRSLQTQKGRELLVKMLEAPGGFDYPKMAVLAQFLRAQTATEGPALKEFRSTMKSRDIPIEEKVERAMEKAEAEKAKRGILKGDFPTSERYEELLDRFDRFNPP